ncbi:MAG: hypothetical protein EOO92_20085 [Pedobacter sp.]|nr:MAG: hypothetical protein EOO92_20085 [Pedobacter sp.]
MFRTLSKVAILLFCLGIIACSSSNNKPLAIMFSADSTSIVISNVDRAGLLQLQNLKLTDSAYSNLISVLQTPSEKDSAIREELIGGTYQISDSTIVFTPAVSFVKNRDYLVITHINAKFGNAEQVAKGSLSTGVKPVEKQLTR